MDIVIVYVLLGLTGLIAGWALGQLALVYFMDEIFDFIDGCVHRVRKLFKLGD